MKKVKTILIALICIGLVVGFYYYLSNRQPKSVEDTKEISEVTEVLSKNLDTSYPATPREVIKYYNRLLVCFYNEAYTDEEYDKMVDKIRGLMDDELLGNNPKEIYSANLKQDIEAYRLEEKIIASTDVCKSSDVDYAVVKGDKCAYVTASYFLKSKKAYAGTNQEFVLRKDDAGNWKIIGFRLLGGEDGNEEE